MEETYFKQEEKAEAATRRPTLLAIALIVLAALSVGVVSSRMREPRTTGPQPMHTICAKNLASIYVALTKYADEHGRYPKSLEELVENRSPRIWLAHPDQRKRLGLSGSDDLVDYEYYPPERRAPLDTVIVADKDSRQHSDGSRNFLYLDGTIKTVMPEEAPSSRRTQR